MNGRFRFPDRLLAVLMGGCLCLSAVMPPPVRAQPSHDASLDAPIRQVQADLNAALADLEHGREQVEHERRPLQSRHRQLTDTVRARRLEWRRIQEEHQAAAERRGQLERDVARLREQLAFVHGSLVEYRRGAEARMQTAHLQVFADDLTRMDDLLDKARQDDATLGSATRMTLDLAREWNRTRMEAMAFNGEFLDPDGHVRQGAFLAIGPLVYLRDTEGKGAMAADSPGRMLPVRYDGHSSSEMSSIAALVNGDMNANVPVDPSGGLATLSPDDGKNWLDPIRKGGFVMFPLILVGALAGWITLYKFYRLEQLRRTVDQPLVPVLDAVRQRDWTAADQAASRLRSPVGILVREALCHRHAPREHAEEILHERLLSMTPGWESHLGMLAVLGGIAPLLGLLGTVTGMIHTFEWVTRFGTGEARLLSGGISEALITTKFGLTIAIPVLVSHAFLQRRLRVIIGRLEHTVTHVLNQLLDIPDI